MLEFSRVADYGMAALPVDCQAVLGEVVRLLLGAVDEVAERT